jgi:hypothetical protein
MSDLSADAYESVFDAFIQAPKVRYIAKRTESD